MEEKRSKITKSKQKKLNTKKIQILVVAIIIVILIVIGISKLMEKKPIENDVQEMQLPEFEKIAVYEYIEKNILQSDLLECYQQTEQGDAAKLNYTIQKCVEEQNKKTISEEIVNQKYLELFQETLDSNTFMMPNPESNYQYDMEKREITLREERKGQTKNYQIERIDTNGNRYFIAVNIIEAKNKEEFMNEYSQLEEQNQTLPGEEPNQTNTTLPNIDIQQIEKMDEEQTKEYFNTILNQLNQEQKEKLQEKVGSAKIELKVENGTYQILNYEESLQSEMTM